MAVGGLALQWPKAYNLNRARHYDTAYTMQSKRLGFAEKSWRRLLRLTPGPSAGMVVKSRGTYNNVALSFVTAALLFQQFAESSFGALPIEIEWARQPVGGIYSDVSALDIGTQGQVYVAGSNGTSTFLSKYSREGSVVWSATVAGAIVGGVNQIVADGESIYAVGTVYNGLESDGFIAKYDDFGHQEWSVALGESGHYSGFHAAASDGSGNILVAAFTSGNLAGETSGSYDAIIAKYRTDGTLLWVKQFGSALGDFVDAVDSDNEGNLYLTGGTEGSLYGNNARGGPHGSFFSDTFVAKFDVNGAEVWSTQYGDPFDDTGTGIAVDSNGSVFVTGHTRASRGATSAGSLDVFVEKLDNDGNRLWVQQFGTAKQDWSYDIDTDDSGNLLVASNQFDIDNPAASNFDGFVRSMNSQGTLQWQFDFVTQSHDQVHDIVVDSRGSVIIGGYAGGDLFGSSTGGRSGFLVKLREVPELRSFNLFVIALCGCRSVLRCRHSSSSILWIRGAQVQRKLRRPFEQVCLPIAKLLRCVTV